MREPFVITNTAAARAWRNRWRPGAISLPIAAASPFPDGPWHFPHPEQPARRNAAVLHVLPRW